MSLNIQNKIEDIRNQTQQYGNTRGKVADVLTAINNEKIDKDNITDITREVVSLVQTSNGWYPVYEEPEVTLTDGSKVTVRKIIDYKGGIGSIPDFLTVNIGKYYAKAGGFTTDVNLATNYRGMKGSDGTGAAIATWIAQSYTGLVQVIKDDKIWELPSGQTASATDSPGISPKWVEKIGGGSDPIKVAFNSVVKFDQKKKYSTINQAGTINFTYDSGGVIKEAIDKRYIVSDGVSDINFSSAFDVIGEIDKTKNQEIYFTRPELVEFKIPAVIINVAKSGQTTPVNLDPDAQLYYDKIIAAGATLSTAETNAMNNFYLAAKANGYFSKLKGLYLVLGSNTSAKLLNGISGRPDATLASGTITADGIGGVLDSGMKPSDIFSLTSFSYGIHNTTAIYSNLRSMGCGVSSTSGITFLITGTSPSGQSLISGPNRDIFGQVSNADSLGNYVVSRTAATTAKLYRNGSAILTHSASQGSATLPNINFAIGGYNDNGTIADDTRVSKWAFLGDGLTDAEVSSIVTDLNTLMSAIGR